MRIAMLTPGFSANEADWAIPALQHLIRALSRLHDIQIVSLRYPYQRAEYPFYGANVATLGGGDASGVQRLPIFLQALRVIRSDHKSKRFDLIHGLWADEAGFLAIVAGARLRKPAVVSVMGGELVGFPDLGYGGQLSRINRILTRTAIEHADLVTIGSQRIRRYVERHRRVKTIECLPLGVDIDLFKPQSTQRSEIGMSGPGPHLLCAASLTPIKNHALLLKAFRAVVDRIPLIHLHLIGDGPLRHKLENQSSSLSLQNHITFHGAILHPRLVDYYNAADLLIVSSDYESQGMVVLEAGACGLPTVGTAVGLIPELEPATLAVPVQNAPALAQAIEDVILNPPRRTEMARAVLSQVHNRYTIQGTVESLSALYDRVRPDK